MIYIDKDGLEQISKKNDLNKYELGYIISLIKEIKQLLQSKKITLLHDSIGHIDDISLELKEPWYISEVRFRSDNYWGFWYLNEFLHMIASEIIKIINRKKEMIKLLNYMENEIRQRKFCCRGDFLRLIRKTRGYIENERWDKLASVIQEWLRWSEDFAEMLFIFLDWMLTPASGDL
jgi:hypothetical protein